MQPSIPILQPAHRPVLPLDLGDWVDRQVLAEWAREEIESLDWSNPELVAFLAANPKFQPKLMLCVLTYAYATGMLGSEEIVRNSAADEIIRSMAGRNVLTATSIKRFRRENRGLLRWSLAQVFKRAFKKHFGLEDSLLPAGLRGYAEHTATLRINIARQMDRTEEP